MKKRIITICLVAALLATCFAGTYAYLTDTKAVKNTFTTGNVYITMDEAKVVKNAAGNLVADGNNRNAASTTPINYHLFPGMTVTKDPTIYMDAESEDAWVAAKITFTGYNAYELISGGVLKTDAVEVVVDSGNANVLYVYVKSVQTKTSDPIVLFNMLTIPSAWNNTEMNLLDGMNIDVEAFAVQANGFANCKEAMQKAFATVFPANP